MAQAYYYLLVCYDIGALQLNESSDLNGPYKSPQDRDKALAKDLANRYCEEEVVNVTKLTTKAGKLISEASYLAELDE